LSGSFAFVLYDNKTKTLLGACDPHGKVPFYWGIAADGTTAFSDDAKLLKQGCGKSFAPFPQGCYFSSAGGLCSYAHPSTPLKPVPRIDSQGQMCGSMFKVDSQQLLKQQAAHGNLGVNLWTSKYYKRDEQRIPFCTKCKSYNKFPTTCLHLFLQLSMA
jgi:asparagine synthetase B (glutamine-hydrolysing)